MQLVAVSIDCVDVDALSQFWCFALESTVRQRWTDAHSKLYVEIPIDTGGGDIVVLLQPVDDATQGKNRVHLDIRPTGRTQEQEVDRLCQGGATIVDRAPGNHWIVVADPEGNEFCVLPPH